MAPVSQSKQLQEALHALTAAQEKCRVLEQAFLERSELETIGRFATGVIHHYNNLSQVVLLHCTRLQQDDGRHSAQHSVAAISQAHAVSRDQVRQLINKIRHRDTPPGLTSINEAVSQVIAAETPFLNHSIAIVLQLAPALPPILINRWNLDQLLTNLILNARDAMPEGGTLTLTSLSHNGQIELQVRDTGIGMNTDSLQTLELPFSTTKTSGFGWGLMNVHTVMTEAGGQVSLESMPGQGTTVTLRWPPAAA